MSNEYSGSSGSGGDGYRDSGYPDDRSGYRGSYRGGYRGRGRGAYRGRASDRGGYYSGGGYLSRYNPYYGGSTRERGGYSSYNSRDSYRGGKYETSRPGSHSDDAGYDGSYQDGYQERYDTYGSNYDATSDEGSYGYGLSLYRGSYRGGYKGAYSSRGGYGKPQYEPESSRGTHLGRKEHISSPTTKPRTPQHKSAPPVKSSSNPWVTILQINDDATKKTFEDTYEQLSRIDKELHELQHSKLKLENSVGSLERQAVREELHVQITNEKLEEFTFL